ncbi:MAG: ABC transporter substrate-binding protein [Giesbergeria sp.]
MLRRTAHGLLALCLATCALGTPVYAQPSPSRVVFNLSLEPSGLDPTIAPSASIGEVVHYNVFEGLAKIEEDGTTSPLLASSWEVDPDGKTYRFALRKNVRFHDGSPFDATAVRFSFERAMAAGSTNKAKKALFDNIAAIQTPEPHTVVLRLHHADANTLFRLGENTAVVLHPATAEKAASHPVGTGPYRFERWKRGHSIVLTKFDGYRRASEVQIGEVQFRFINDPAAQVAALEAREVDVFFNIATRTVAQFQADGAFQVLIGASGGKGTLALNHRRKPLDDVRVRRAITHAIDREGFIRDVLDGRGKAIGSHFSPTDAGYVHLAGLYPYDPERAKALMREADVRLPLKLTLALPPTPYAQVGGPLVVAALAKIGIEVTTESLDWAHWLSGPFSGNFDLTLINHVEPLDYQIYTDPTYYFGYDSADFRALVERHAASGSARERQILFAQIQRQLAQDAVNAWIFAPQISTVARKGLKGLWMNYPIFVHDLAALRWE